MKIYNKKGFFSGLVSAALGIALLAAGWHTGFERFDLKDAFLVVVLLLIGIVQAARSFSRALSREDIISDLDERNTLVKFKSCSPAFGITQGVCFVLAVVFILLGAYHDYDGMTGIGLGFAFAISVSFFPELFSYFYYESKN